MVDMSPLVNYILIQLYSYIGTKHIFRRLDRRRRIRYQKLQREATEIENFVALLISFIIGGTIYLIASQYVPVLAEIGPSIWLGYAVLFFAGFLLARKWSMLNNPYS
ncbi:MAG: hypothetical protein KGH98_01360 [Candidatus Micrarchaeota archaeon]|nr:hypothetical protein [Candidatus Micrarchaeota archaeon]